MNLDRFRKIIGCILLVSFVFIGFFSPLGVILQSPKEVTLFEGQNHLISSTLPVQANHKSDHLSVAFKEEEISLNADSIGHSEVYLEFAGVPVKKIDVNILKNIKVIPGGQSIGVKINSKGVLVVGHHLVEGNNRKISPGEEAGIKVGDLIIKMNGKTIEKLNEISSIVQESGITGKPVHVVVERNHETIETKIMPEKDRQDQKYKLGLYIRDSAAGIGTMTFYEPTTKKYGALGHVISDMDTKLPIVVKDGYIVPSTVTSIQKGSNGVPGEKLARLLSEKETIGNIKTNNQFGIFGTLNKPVENGITNEAIPIALADQVKRGPAQIFTVVEENKVERFDIEIVNSIPQKFPATKGLVIKITDPKLLEKTGGIVQGMSGSPIIQDGRLIGAVTHVFVNDPTSGYGVHIEWMLNEAGINIPKKQMDKAS